MPTEQELLAMCLRWLQHPQGDAFDKAMLIAAVKAKLYPPSRPWVGLTDEERFEVADISVCVEDVVAAVEAKLKEKNT
jgi:hypothetical protein